MPTPETGLRERKKRRTRQAIVDAAVELFNERGYERTTVADIAAAADIAPRTFFAYFPSKEHVLFDDFDALLESMRERLDAREPGETAIDALREWILGSLARQSSSHEHERARCRQRVVGESQAVAAHERHLMARFEEALAQAVAKDLGSAPGDPRAAMVAAAAVAALQAIDEQDKGQDPMAVVDQALTFLRGGMAALR